MAIQPVPGCVLLFFGFLLKSNSYGVIQKLISFHAKEGRSAKFAKDLKYVCVLCENLAFSA
ncbi:hypothetical protein FH5T_09640 [Draconibacterium orientale]|uniref:Secreted protein n=1 Tax=Draconibacterium orientale TaxID=1168034 RepID=A0ABN4D410_9BACT|nr:hypothetical protein FH5T_09640 [Draconibacterium orientale]